MDKKQRPRRTPRQKIIFLGLIALGIIFLALRGANSVFAISDPSSLSIVSIRAYSGALETSDLLVVVHYDIVYSSIPAEQASEAYLGRFMRGTTELRSVEPFPFNDKGYNEGVLSFYWTPTQMTDDSIEFNDTNSEGYSVILQGKMSVFPGTVPSTEASLIDWRDSSQTTDALYDDLVAQAYELEQDADWSANSQDLIAATTGVDAFTTTGENYFSGAIPNLQSMVPKLFSTSVRRPEATERTFSNDHAQALEDTFEGNWMETRFTTLATTLRAPRNVITTIFAFILMGIAAFGAAALFKDRPADGMSFGMLTFAVTIPLFASIGWLPFEIAAIVAFMGLLGLGWTLFLRRAGT